MYFLSRQNRRLKETRDSYLLDINLYLIQYVDYYSVVCGLPIKAINVCDSDYVPGGCSVNVTAVVGLLVLNTMCRVNSLLRTRTEAAITFIVTCIRLLLVIDYHIFM